VAQRAAAPLFVEWHCRAGARAAQREGAI
jgi:hypothetical protein